MPAVVVLKSDIIQDEDNQFYVYLIVGSLEDWQQHDIDAAITKLNGNRTPPTPFLQYLDAQNGEVSTIPIEPIGAPTLGVLCLFQAK